MKKISFSISFFLIFSSAFTLFSQNPTDPVWGVYASGVGEKLSVGMNPCWVTYTVGLVADVKIQLNVENGSMGAILTNVNWYEASAAKRKYSRYFDDEADGIYKLTPCEVKYPDLNGAWVCTMHCPAGGEGKKAYISQNGTKLTFTNENGDVSKGYFENPGVAVATDWDNLKVYISDGAKTLGFTNGTVWKKHE